MFFVSFWSRITLSITSWPSATNIVSQMIFFLLKHATQLGHLHAVYVPQHIHDQLKRLKWRIHKEKQGSKDLCSKNKYEQITLSKIATPRASIRSRFKKAALWFSFKAFRKLKEKQNLLHSFLITFSPPMLWFLQGEPS